MTLIKSVDGKDIECTPEEEKTIRNHWAENKAIQDKDLAENSHKYSRKKEYPNIEDQLDMLWHAMDQNHIQKANDFYNIIGAIKNKYPKPKIT